MFNKVQFRDLINRVLTNIGLNSDSATELLMLTAATESGFGTYIRQINGPARGVFQMEPNTENDIWNNYLKYKPELSKKINNLKMLGTTTTTFTDLEVNLAYQIAMTRIHYLRVPSKIPNSTDITGLATYWKNHYNTSNGAGDINTAISNYKKYAQ